MNITISKYYIYALLLLFLIGCNSIGTKPDDDANPVVAKVYDEYLYLSDLENIVPDNTPAKDSLTMINDYVSKWAKNELLLYYAETNLLPEEKDVEEKIMEYRTSLLTHKYEQNLIQKDLNPFVSKKEIRDYYENFSDNFMLSLNLVKGQYMKLPDSAPDINKAKRLFQSKQDKNITAINSYAEQYAEHLIDFEENWLPFNEILDIIPDYGMNPQTILKQRKYMFFQDTAYYYFLRVDDYRLTGDVAPIEYVEENIKSIVLNKRKAEIINGHEESIYEEALKKGNLKIY